MPKVIVREESAFEGDMLRTLIPFDTFLALSNLKKSLNGNEPKNNQKSV